MSDRLKWIVALRAGHSYNEKSLVKGQTSLKSPVFEACLTSVEEARERGL